LKEYEASHENTQLDRICPTLGNAQCMKWV